MKKIILAVIILLASTVCSYAATLPPMSAGAYYSFKDKGINAISTFEAVKIKDLVALELGVAGDSDKSNWKGVAAISLDIQQLKLSNYVKLPILDLIAFRPAFVVGLGQINGQNLSGAKFDCGIGATIISARW